MLYDRYLQKMEDALAVEPWLAGETFSLADIGMAPYVNRLAMMGMAEMWTKSRPRLTDWFARVQARAELRAGVHAMVSAAACQRLRHLRRQSWPEVRRILAAA